MENTVEMTSEIMTSEKLRVMFDDEIFRLYNKRNGVTPLNSVRANAESVVICSLITYHSSDVDSPFPVFIRDALDFMAESLRRFFPAGVAEYALRIVDGGNVFLEQSELDVIEAAGEACIRADSQKNWDDWDKTKVNQFVERIQTRRTS